MIKPMLAHKFDEKRVNWSKNVYVQPKLDGVRCLFTKDGAYSRAGNKFMNVEHIEKSLKKFFKDNPDIILDGELYNHELKNDFEKIISLVRKQKRITKKERAEAKKLVQFHVYDYIDDKYESYGIRMNNLVVSDIYDKHIIYVNAKLVTNFNAAKQYHKEYLDQGYEGSIMRLGSNVYKHGRSYGLMKFKDFHDTEAIIIGYEIGKGKRKGTLGKFIMQDDDGVEFGCPPGKGYTYEDMKNMLDNIKDYIGKRATFTYFQRTKAGSYRHPLFKGLRNYE
jgi:DNA ligase-1